MKKGTLILLILMAVSIGLDAQTKGVLTVNVTTISEVGATSPTQGRSGSRSYAPRNILAIWIEDSNGKFVKTLLLNSRRYTIYLESWQAVTTTAGSPSNMVDAVTGATNMNHGMKTCIWDGTDFKGNVVADGTYRVCMELTEYNAAGNKASFEIIKGISPVIHNPEPKTNFSSVNLKWEPVLSSLSKN